MIRVTQKQWPWLLLCVAAAVVTLGYHPAAEDGGIYLAALEAKLNPALFPHFHAFAVAHTSRSLYVPGMAVLAQVLPVMWLMLLVHVASLAATACALAAIAEKVFASVRTQRLAVLFALLAMALPVAGTALYGLDPYVTARSISTPLILFAMVCVLRRRWWWAMLLLVVSAVIHPLMTVWGALAVLLVPRRTRWLVCAITLAGGACVYFASPLESALMQQLCATRAYWYLARWAWFEWVGIAAPIVLLLTIRRRLQGDGRRLADAAVTAYALATALNLLFVHEGDARLLMERAQPMRLAIYAYVVFFLLLAGVVAEAFPRVKMRVATVVVMLAVGVPVVAMERGIYDDSRHLELPWLTHRNPWSRAFIWVREHVPVEAVVALDAAYTTAPDEDAQTFRALALRSSPPDEAKDGGVASVMPALAKDWQRGSVAQRGLETATDAERVEGLRPLGVTWVVLRSESKTGFACPYDNGVAKVCRLP